MFDPRLMDMIMRLRSRGISDNDVLRAMETVPRRAFVPMALADKAYDDQSLPIACGQSLSPPLTIAMMTQVLGATKDHKLLEIGTGSGYHAGILSRLAKRVYSVERYKQLAQEAEARFADMKLRNIHIRHGDGRYGWPGQAPFDRIIVTCGLLAAPDGLLDQLAPNGKMAAVIDGELMVFEKAKKRVSETVILPLSLPMIEAGKSKAL